MGYGYGWGYGFRPYVSVAQKRARAQNQMKKLEKKGTKVSPVQIEGRTIAKSFWGKGWCDHMESFHDFENRLPRGRTYVRNGSVVHLEITAGTIKAFVAGSDTYTVTIKVAPLPKKRWAEIKKNCAGQIASLVDLLQGRLSDGVMRQVANRDNGLFPHPKELTMQCSCPDWSTMCKHVAAVCYGVGSRLDKQPELLFLLRGVDHSELVAEAAAATVIDMGAKAAKRKQVKGSLSDVFGIDLAGTDEAMATMPEPAVKKPPARKPAKRAVAKTIAKAKAKTKTKRAPAKAKVVVAAKKLAVAKAKRSSRRP